MNINKKLFLPSWLVPPALRPDGEQGLGQPLQAQAGQGRSHGEPHVTGPGLTRRPGCLENQLSLLQGAVQQTDLQEKEKKEQTRQIWDQSKDQQRVGRKKRVRMEERRQK